MRHQPTALDDVADAQSEFDRIVLRHVLSVDDDRPEVGSTIRLIIRMDVVLPQPDGPTNTVSVPSGTSSVRSSTATVPSGYRLVTPANEIIYPGPDRDIEAVFLHPVAGGLVRIDPGVSRLPRC